MKFTESKLDQIFTHLLDVPETPNAYGNAELQSFLNSDPKENQIPVIQKKPKTFLGIAKQPHYENVLSNIYAFFFNVHEEHGLKDLFIKSLIACIAEAALKDKDFSTFADFDIETEYATRGLGKLQKRGRIDLLLYNNDQAIIIENKVYHHLNNDLDDYWHSVKLNTENTNSKIGIILSLKPVSKDQWQRFEKRDEFINVTHLKLIQKVKDNMSLYVDHSNQHFQFVFNDLYQNIVNMSHPTMNEENIHFFLEHKQKINQLVDFKYAFKSHVISEIEKAGQSMHGLKLVTLRKGSFNEKRLRYYQSIKHSELIYTIVFEDLLKGSNYLHIIIEPRGKTLIKGHKFREIVFDEAEEKLVQDSFYTKTNQAWAHFASVSYQLTENDIADLSDFIQKKISEDHFASTFAKLENYLLENPTK